MKKVNTFLLALALFGVVLFPAQAKGKKDAGGGGAKPKVSSYIRTWPLGLGAESDKGGHWTADMVHGEYLTDIIIAFALIDQSDFSTIYIKDMVDQESEFTPGVIVPGFTDLWRQTAALKEEFPNLKINLSVGGYKAEFTHTAEDPDTRAKFIANVCEWLQNFGLDGVDIDWEYPVGPDWGVEIETQPADRDNYILLLSELRAALDKLGKVTGKRYGLSVAVPASPWFCDKNRAQDAAKIVDVFKLMAYDYYGGWSKTTGHHANLRTADGDPEWGGWSTAQAVQAFLEAGVPPNKIVLGVGFYGHAWEGVSEGARHGLFQGYERVSPLDGLGWDKIKLLLEADSGYTRYWDDEAKAPYLYNGDTFISYTDAEAIGYITEYAKRLKLGGVFVWEYAHDINGELLMVLSKEMQ
ncbi:MAG: glycoside hydrolase family 18 protein [Spirochaetaceae bacterium]|jgi:chitinase|nr:glycoside hydrolase family 18 protein [Spirochaetaceae bacterium]